MMLKCRISVINTSRKSPRYCHFNNRCHHCFNRATVLGVIPVGPVVVLSYLLISLFPCPPRAKDVVPQSSYRYADKIRGEVIDAEDVGKQQEYPEIETQTS